HCRSLAQKCKEPLLRFLPPKVARISAHPKPPFFGPIACRVKSWLFGRSVATGVCTPFPLNPRLVFLTGCFTRTRTLGAFSPALGFHPAGGRRLASSLAVKHAASAAEQPDSRANLCARSLSLSNVRSIKR